MMKFQLVVAFRLHSYFTGTASLSSSFMTMSPSSPPLAIVYPTDQVIYLIIQLTISIKFK